MTSRGKPSLRIKFLLLLTIVAVAITFLGAFATYRIASQQLEEQLLLRGKLLASAINHSAMIAKNESEFSHVAREVMHDNPEVTGIVILSQNGERTIFEDYLNRLAISREASEHLKAEARHALSTGSFGLHSDDADHISTIVPLTTPIGSHSQMTMGETDEGPAQDRAAEAPESTRQNGSMKGGDDQAHRKTADSRGF